jgi:CRISPR-associated protein Cmr6
MATAICLPDDTVKLIKKVGFVDRHPGLQLDKYLCVPERQEEQKETLQPVCQAKGDNGLLMHLSGRRQAYLSELRANVWTGRTTGPLTLHLARASAMENAGLCLHPIYGFAYLPGSGLKGMARAFAEKVWLPAQPDRLDAWRRIEDVFGWAPNPDRKKQIKNPNHPAETRWPSNDRESPAVEDCAGSIVFHDSWPENWPQLLIDIVNNHHARYYQGNEAPGDWESPIMVSFLAVPPNTKFNFALSKRRYDVPDWLLQLARDWLAGALTHLGAGAKTAAGYGAFELVDEEKPRLPQSDRIAAHEIIIELVTPAFLAGASQNRDDCDLRSATLRGLLRWWWRTMHSSFVNNDVLRGLEAAVWGDTKQGGAVRLTVEAAPSNAPILYDVKDGFRMKPEFKNSHNLQEPSRGSIPGVFYQSYGMADGGRKRWYLPEGTRWKVSLTARPSKYLDQQSLSADIVLRQALSALWLLAQMGGVGSKGRKGFGSVDLVDEPTSCDLRLEEKTLEWCQEEARRFREACGLTASLERIADSSALEKRMDLELLTPWSNSWFVLHQIGFAAQSFAQKYKHKEEKRALGLPRKIHGPRNEPMNTQTLGKHQRPQNLRVPKGDRFASPVHYHLAQAADGRIIIRVTAFPSKHLPNQTESERMLKELLAHLKTELEKNFKNFPGGTASSSRPPAGPRGTVPSQAFRDQGVRGLPDSGQIVQAELLDEKTKKGGWKARHPSSGLSGPISNTNDVPSEKTAGDSVKLVVASANNKEISFRWPTEKELNKPVQPKGKPSPFPPRKGR